MYSVDSDLSEVNKTEPPSGVYNVALLSASERRAGVGGCSSGRRGVLWLWGGGGEGAVERSRT